eukprot:SM000088S23725  [mRNA]  locus=s88:281592:282100:+ [translate_table: standard]
MAGIIAIVLLIIFFPFLACIPCCMPDCFNVMPQKLELAMLALASSQYAAVLVKHQRPVYGYPQQHQATAAAYVQPPAPQHATYGVPVAVPVANYA